MIRALGSAKRLPLVPPEEKGAHGGGQSVADGHHIGSHLLHGVVDRQAGCHRSAWRVDVDLNVFFRILGFEEEHLCHQGISDGIVNAGAEEDDLLTQQARVDVEGPVTAAGLFHHRGQHAGCGLGMDRHGLNAPPAVLNRMGSTGVDHAATGGLFLVCNLWAPLRIRRFHCRLCPFWPCWLWLCRHFFWRLMACWLCGADSASGAFSVTVLFSSSQPGSFSCSRSSSTA